MSENQTVWTMLWNHAAAQPTPGSPFEIGDIVPAVAAALHAPEAQALALVSQLLDELGRLPEGRQFFAREGNAVVPLSRFLQVSRTVTRPVDAYPFEL